MILRPYQEVGRDFLASRRFALLADEMRVGKTPQAILAAQKLLLMDVLVVCPAIAVEHWKREWMKWWPDFSGNLEVLSYERAKMRRTVLLAARWDLVVVDEAHFAKNPKAERTKLVYGKGGLGYVTKFLWSLSGTPAPKHAAELWPMLRAFGAVGLSYSEFVRRYCYCLPGSFEPIGTKQSMIPELKGILAKVMLRRKRADVAPDMPAIDFQFLETEIDCDLALPPGLRGDALVDYARQYVDKENRIEVAKAKAGKLAEHIAFAIENGLLKQTVVFGWHVEPLNALASSLTRGGIHATVINGATSPLARTLAQEDFRAGKVQVICANIMAAGTAIDLSAASHGYFLELDWVPGNNMQAANRLVSMDKKEPVTFDICTSPGTMDDHVQRVLLRRATETAMITG